MNFEAVMFDLDGTLADTLADIAASANHALTGLGRPTFPVPRYRYLAGQGLESLMTDALGPEHRGLVARGMELFHSYYVDHSLDRTAPYPMIPDLLDALTARGTHMAVLSNKPNANTQEVVAKVFQRWRFAAIRGQVEGGPLKPDPAAALEIAAKLAIPPHRWLFVGDTRADMLTAKGAGMFAVGVLWGFRDEAELRASGADRIIGSPLELLELFSGGL